MPSKLGENSTGSTMATLGAAQRDQMLPKPVTLHDSCTKWVVGGSSDRLSR
jgi:hypothetical protein